MSNIEHSNGCPTCDGDGWEDATDMGAAAKEPCATCDGDGRVVGVKQLEAAVQAMRDAMAAIRVCEPGDAHRLLYEAVEATGVNPTTGGQ